MQPEKDLAPGDIIILRFPPDARYEWDTIKCVVERADDEGLTVRHLEGDEETYTWRELTRIGQAAGTEHTHPDGSPRVLPEEMGRRAGEAW